MAYGKFNRIVLQLGYQGQITGDGSDNAVSGCHVLLPAKAMLVDARVSCSACGATTSKISVYKGTTKICDQFSLSSSTKTGQMTLTAAKSGTIYDAGSEFSLKEETTNGGPVDDISVQLTFRAYEA